LSEALLLEETRTYDDGSTTVTLKAVPCSKRGNRLYFQRNDQRLAPLFHALDCVQGRFFDPHGNVKKTPLVQIVLTYPRDRSLHSTWLHLGADVNRYLASFRQKHGKIAVLRTWESHADGYAHVNFLIYCFETTFDVFSYHGRWRIVQKSALQCGWIGFFDVFAVESWKSAGKYVMKHVAKELTHDRNSSHDIFMQTMSLMMTWLFRKRSFSISGAWDDLIRGLRNSKDLGACSGQETADSLCGDEEGLPYVVSFRFLGVVPARVLPDLSLWDSFDWTHELRMFLAVSAGESCSSMDFDALFDYHSSPRAGGWT
jgi:hypothetical protein